MDEEEQEKIIEGIAESFALLKQFASKIREVEGWTKKYPQKEEEFIKLLSRENRARWKELTSKIESTLRNL